MRVRARSLSILGVLLALSSTSAFACLTTPAPSNFITSLYGWRFHPVYKRWRLHEGADFRAQLDASGQGTQLVAAQAGTVQIASSASGGNELRIVGSGGVLVRYLHLTKPMVKPGAQVSAGQTVAVSGGTGEASTAPHLHFETWVNKHVVNPESLLCNAAQHKSGSETSDGFPILQCDPQGGQSCPGSTGTPGSAGGSSSGGGTSGSGNGSSGGTDGGSSGTPPTPSVPTDSDPPPSPDTAAWDDMSTIELITTEVYKRFGNPDWFRETSERSSGPLLQEYMQMMALDNYMNMRRQLSVERTDQLWSVKSARDVQREMRERLKRQRDVVNRSP